MKVSSLKVALKNKTLLSLKENFVFEYFSLEFEKGYCHFRNQYPQIFNYAKFHAKIKNTFTTKDALFRYFFRV